ncbi:ABC transporter substrate-binding protein [Xylanibacillus composti]|uniref:Extracellular solute-binding protein n=1 Tax=Xylanibacillus composti TaxID=1572762 RepID=A0A8J4H427_9BACL|nr:ABC transporter substrate-binding protein [Xylanibacillus composti]GIQ70573.1 hypothetical protein XYCOK13_33970 [Xylanibacillus composti]
MKGTRWLTRIAPVLVLMLLASACSFGAGNADNEVVPSTLKVMYYDERSFFQQYGMLFSATHPHVDIEVASTQNLFSSGTVIEDYNQMMLDFIEDEQPDVLMLSAEQYTELAQDGRLYELSKLTSDESFDLEGLMPGLIDYMTELSDGKLYGLSPTFHSQVIYYNVDLFEQYGVPQPTDQMSWEQLIELAMRFPTDGGENRVYGLKAGYEGSVSELATMIAGTYGLSLIDPGQMQVLINTDAWKSAFQTALNAVQSGTLYVQDPENWFGGGSYEEYLLQDPFISGKLAMAVDGQYLINQLDSAQDYLQDRGIQNWDLITMPVDPNNPDVSAHVNLSNIFAINANSANIEAAEQFIRYLHSDEFARVSSRSHLGSGFPVRTKYIESKEDINMEAFYKLKPASNELYRDYGELPAQFFSEFQGILQEELDKVINGDELLDNALDNLQVRAQEALIRAKQQEEEEKAQQGEAATVTEPVVQEGQVSIEIAR